MLLKYINTVVGPIQNLIITGHGNSNVLGINEKSVFNLSDAQTDEFMDTVAELMPQDDKLVRSILLDSCLTDSFRIGKTKDGAYYSAMNFADTFFSRLKWKDRSHFIAPKASTSRVKVKNTSQGFHAFDNEEFDSDTNTYFRNKLTGFYLFSSSSETYYKGEGAEEMTGHLRGILECFYFEQSAEVLWADLAYFKGHFMRNTDDFTPEQIGAMVYVETEIGFLIDEARDLIALESTSKDPLEILDKKISILEHLGDLAASIELHTYKSVTEYKF